MATPQSGTMAVVFGYKIDLMKELGRGTFGTVYKGYGENNSIVAVKKIHTETKEDQRNASREAWKFHSLKDRLSQRNDHITAIYDVKYLENAIWIAMEFCDLGDLNQFFRKYCSSLNTNVKVKLMKQIMAGIAFLHGKDIVHRDIKPGNILLTSTPGRHVVVKLGDFGLSKILDPDSQTSTMSSNVGTLMFKAPEFWFQKPGDKIRYHRNVDVYAAGLTFTAMMQAEPNRNLIPKAEGPVQPTELAMPIGLIAYNRIVYQQEDITVLEDRVSDSKVVKRVKEVIREMTHISPSRRLAALQVIEKLQEPLISQQCAFSQGLPTDPVCLLHGHPFCRSFVHSTYSITTYNEEAGYLVKWHTNCEHYLPHGLLKTYKVPGSCGGDHLAEGCAICGVIRSYDPRTGKSKVVFKDVKPYMMCDGPENGFLVYDLKTGSLIQLAVSNDDHKGNLKSTQKIAVDLVPFQGMCFSDLSKAVVLSNIHNNQVSAVNLENGHTMWQIIEFIRLGQRKKLDPKDICSTPNGWIYVANGENILILDAFNGDPVRIMDDPNMQINFLVSDSAINSHVTDSGINSHVTDSPSATPAKGFHKVLCYDNGSSHVLALQRDDTILTYDATFLPAGHIVLKN